MDSLGIDSANSQSIELICNENNKFVFNGDIISLDKIHAATCTGIIEPMIIREEESDCSHGLGADGRTDDLGTIVLAKIGWDFGNDFKEQVSLTLIMTFLFQTFVEYTVM